MNMEPENKVASLFHHLVRQMTSAGGNVTVQLSDLLVFLGYFGLCLYVGGIAHIAAFNAELSMTLMRNDNAFGTALLFLGDVASRWWSGLLLALAIAMLALIYFLARFAFRLWFGLTVVISVFCLSLVVCAAIGAERGKSAARDGFVSSRTVLPVIKFPESSDSALKDGEYRLLHDNGTHLFIIEPTGSEASVRGIRALLIREVSNYEVIIQ